MTLKEIRSMIQIWADDIAGKRGTITLYNTFINKAQDKFAEIGLILGRWAECNSVADQWDYKIFDKVLKLLRVYVYDDDSDYWKPIDSVEKGYLDKTNDSWLEAESKTVPDQYYLEGDRLGFYPPFDAAVSPGIRIEYIRKPDTLSEDGDISLIPSQYHHHLAKEAFVMMFPGDAKVQQFIGELRDAYQIMSEHTMEDDMGRRTVISPAS